MRTFTDKDKRGLLIALRVMFRELNNERISGTVGARLIDKVINYKISIDKLLNRFNFERFKNAAGDPEGVDADKYVDYLIDASDAKKLAQEPEWYDQKNGFALTVKAVHDFYLEVSGKGGKWDLPSAFTNLGKAIQSYGLHGIMSSKLIDEVLQKTNPENGGLTFFSFVAQIINDVDSPYETLKENIEPDVEPEPDEAPTEQFEGPQEPATENEERPEDEPYPEEYDGAGFESIRLVQTDANEIKKKSLRSVLGYFTANELIGIVKTIDGGMDMTIDEVLDRLATGQFDVQSEDMATREVHRQINGYLTQDFIDCAHVQCHDITEEDAAEYDILYESWDMREPNTRKMHKLLKLIYTEGKDDPDLMDAVNDIEKLYSQKE